MTKAERLEKQRKRLVEMRLREEELHEQGYVNIAGVDEVGRGPLAGPVVAAAVILPADFDVLGIDDSKKLSEKKREELFEVITAQAVAYGIGMADHETIDEINILQATKLAMKRALTELSEKLQTGNCEKTDEPHEKAQEILQNETGKPAEVKGEETAHKMNEIKSGKGSCSIDYILFDAMKIEDIDIPQESIIKGDAKVLAIAAASIVAKVTRDRMMVEYAKEYPGYAFEKNKGYGTKAHYEGIEAQGICPIHRRTFLKKIIER